MRSEWKKSSPKTYAIIKTEQYQALLERSLKECYRDAAEGLQKTIDDFIKHFADEDARMAAELAAGEITKLHYQSWRMNQIGQSERYKTMQKQMSDRMVNADKVAASYINDTAASIYALNHDYTCFQIDNAGIMEGGSFTLTNERTIRELVNSNHVNFRVMNPDRQRDYKWCADRIQRTLTVDLLQGKSMDKIAADFLNLMGNNTNAAIRNARTAVTSAQSAGCQAAFDEAADMGIEFEKEWIATNDDRTRDSHAALDGERVPNDAEFSNGLMYPGDPNGDPAEVYNCRCTMRAVIPGINERKSTSNDEKTYTTWRERHEIEGGNKIESGDDK